MNNTSLIAESKILVIGATSVIALEALRKMAAPGKRFFLVARSREKLESVAQDLKARGVSSADTMVADLADFSRHSDIIDKANSSLHGIDLVFVAHGVLGDPNKALEYYSEFEDIIRVNFLSVVSLLTNVIALMQKQKKGKIAVIGSVAGDRGRQNNPAYCSAKGALAIYLGGLRNRLHNDGIHVLTIKPGFVDTPMTDGMRKGPLFASPQSVANGIVRAIAHNRNIVYIPWFWRIIMTIIVHIPEVVFKRLKI